MGTEESGDIMRDPEFHKRTLGALIAALTFATAAVSCSSKVSNDKNTSEVSETEENTDSTLTAQTMSNTVISSDLFSDRDLSPEYESVTAEIKLDGDSISVDGEGASADGSILTITAEGVYHITGTLSDGQIIVNAPDAKVQLVLDGVDVNCSTTSAIYIADCDKTFITLADGSSNTVSDGNEYVFAEDSLDEPDAAIFSEDSITINGNGSLTVNGNYSDGIRSKDDIVITGGTINVTAVNNGIKGKDYVAAVYADVTVTAGGDGIKSTNIEDTSLGFVYIESGTFDITADGDGIQAETVFTAVGGDFNITSGGGSSNAEAHMGDDFGNLGGMNGGFGGGRGNMQGGDFGDRGGFGGASESGDMPTQEQNDVKQTANLTEVQVTDTESTETDDGTISTKGIKAGTALNISGGTFNIDAADDTLHSNDTLTIEGGELTLKAGGDGVHADTQLDINDGTVIISESYEGLEATVINIAGGTVELSSSDDGINASDGSSQGAMGSASSGVALNISGGTVYVNADGDGLDSNGTMDISGGTVIVNGPTNDGNGALDGNSSINVSGGLLIAAGSSGMAEYPDDTSTQNCVSYTFDSSLAGGTLVTLLDSSENEIQSFAPEKQFINIVISSPDIKSGETYTFYTGGSSSSSETYGLYENGGYKNDGTKAESFTAESSVSTIGTQSAMGGGMMNGGGRGGMMNGGMNGGMDPSSMFSDIDGVTVSDDGSISITSEGAENIIASFKEKGMDISATADEISACTTFDELRELIFGSMNFNGTPPGLPDGANGMTPPDGAPGGDMAPPDAANGAA